MVRGDAENPRTAADIVADGAGSRPVAVGSRFPSGGSTPLAGRSPYPILG